MKFERIVVVNKQIVQYCVIQAEIATVLHKKVPLN